MTLVWRADTPWGRAVSEGVLCALPGRSTLRWEKRWEKGICQLSNSISGTRECVNCPRNHIWYSSHNLESYMVKLLITHCHSPNSICLLQRSNGEPNGGVVGINIPESFKPLMVALISAISPGMQCCFWFTILLDREVLKTITWPFPTIIALIP